MLKWEEIHSQSNDVKHPWQYNWFDTISGTYVGISWRGVEDFTACSRTNERSLMSNVKRVAGGPESTRNNTYTEDNKQ